MTDVLPVLQEERRQLHRSVVEQDGGASPSASAWTWLNLWATWCTPCVEEMDLLRR